jgi:cyclophilin family peptidyl-prolyl cis-trans isomerase
MKILIAIFSLFFLSSCSLKSSTKITPNPTMTQQSPITQNPSVTVANTDSVVALKTKDGQIVIKLYSQETPKTVDNFLKKTNSGFYNGLIFHRVISGFMAQGGDPTGTGTGGGSQSSELNQIPFRRGSLGLARTPASKEISNDSQFFICFTTEGCQHLTGDYVNFGEVISGLDVLDKIEQGDKIIEITTKTK